MPVKFIGNLSDKFDCDQIIAQCLEHSGEIHKGVIQLPVDHPEYESFSILDKMAKSAGYYENDAMEFRHFKPEFHFDQKFVDIFSEFVGATPLVTFVSEIKPGKMAPWHFDIDPNDKENRKKGQLVRYHLHLSKPQPGHVFIIDQEVLYNIPQGNIYQWENVFDWHAGTNCGIVPKYLFSFKGYV